MTERQRATPQAARRGLPFTTMVSIGALLLSAGCGGEASDSQGPPMLEACSVLTGADVAAVLGAGAIETEAERRGDDGFWVSSCRYQSEDADGILVASLLLRPHHHDAGAEQAFADYADELAEQTGEDARLEPVEGPWQKAGWQDFGTPIGQLALFQGPYQLIITAPTASADEQLASCRALAERALAQLP